MDVLRRAVGRGVRVLSVCSGVFLLVAAGLLDDRRCAVHWQHAEQLARHHPRTAVEPDVPYLDEGPVITSAATAAGIDARLHIVREEQGPEVANKIARRMVVPPHRAGGQAQYIERPLPRGSCDTVGEVLVRMEEHLGQKTGTAPYRWVLRQRVLRAHELLEGADQTVDAVAWRTGFGTAAAPRHRSVRALGTTPDAYRRTFRGPHAA